MDVDIMNIVKQYYGLETAEVGLIRESSDNVLYKIGMGARSYVLRLAKRTKKDTIVFEAQLIHRLISIHIPTPEWIPTLKDESFATLPDGRIGVLMPYIDGIPVEGDNIGEYARQAGELLASIHNATHKLKLEALQTRTIFSELERAIAQQDIYIRSFGDGKEFIEYVTHYMGAGKERTHDDYIIHNDFRPHNLLQTQEKDLFAIDFDWACYGPAARDLAHAVVEWSMLDGQNEPNLHIQKMFLEGYHHVIHSPVSNDFTFWAAFSCLSDTVTYISDKVDRKEELPDRVRSYMYKKFTYYHGLQA
ncbi:hypothetical protein A3D08_01730 [Candidatus Roizmanbacteria bacterium RIFCSPHIGHO2_02_FULL_43_11]|uniref:Protein kinase domain-containing protein n=1 Tax=Candidatus Roizmanbacteria bacterium RIFCSPHIGHO2_02_FULL_43_11 TaxID=1802043 RepID=A0A1F7HME4_9BACT|nr:MAG: hypothetical protein A3D08_01730 [Candidatus Roizmanbacteria bacterium RIFCSPHIGHO2_02_FULL_43_11]